MAKNSFRKWLLPVKRKNKMESNQPSRGLGDTIERITTATGIKYIVHKATKAVGKKDCGCNKRKEALNKIFPYNNQQKQNNGTA